MLSQHSCLGPHQWAASLGSNAGISQMGSQTSTDGATAGRFTHKTRAEWGWLLADVLMWKCFSWYLLLSSSLANTASHQWRRTAALLVPAVFPWGERPVLHRPCVLYRGPPKKGSSFSLGAGLGTVWPCLLWSHLITETFQSRLKFRSCTQTFFSATCIGGQNFLSLTYKYPCSYFWVL